MVTMWVMYRPSLTDSPPSTEEEDEDWRTSLAQARREHDAWQQEYGDDWNEYMGMDPQQNPTYPNGGSETSEVSEEQVPVPESPITRGSRAAVEQFWDTMCIYYDYETTCPADERIWEDQKFIGIRPVYADETEEETAGASGSGGPP
jgi:hypothetical protein